MLPCTSSCLVCEVCIGSTDRDRHGRFPFVESSIELYDSERVWSQVGIDNDEDCNELAILEFIHTLVSSSGATRCSKQSGFSCCKT